MFSIPFALVSYFFLFFATQLLIDLFESNDLHPLFLRDISIYLDKII